MDPVSVFAISVVMMLLNGGVLGLMHNSLAPQAQPAAVSWRIGTLLMAGGAVLLAVQNALPAGFILPVANSYMIAGMTLHWRGVRQFHDLPDRWWMLLPVIVCALGVYVFATHIPSLSVRVIVLTVTSAAIALSAGYTLHRYGRRYAAVSSVVLQWIFYATALISLARGVYFTLNWQTTISIVDPKLWVNVVTPMAVAILPVIGTTAFLLMCAERLRGELERAATTDYLTGLSNRRTVTRQGEARFAAARAGGASFALAVIDIDHFKRINDQHGHEFGDAALKHVASLLRQACREHDTLGRQGGEEFVVLLDDRQGDDARAIAERLRAAVAQAPLALGELRLPITVSIGVSAIAAQDRDYDAVLRRADQALYAAKSAGRNCVMSQNL